MTSKRLLDIQQWQNRFMSKDLYACTCQGDSAEAMSMSLDGSQRPAASSEDSAYSHLASEAAAAALLHHRVFIPVMRQS